MAPKKKEDFYSAYCMDEEQAVLCLLDYIDAYHEKTKWDEQLIAHRTSDFVGAVRKTKNKALSVENFLQQYSLSTNEGVALMCLAEALLRVPDKETKDKLIEDKLSSAQWRQHMKTAHNTMMGLSSWALMLSEIVMDEGKRRQGISEKTVFGKLAKKVGEPIIRQAMLSAMKMLGEQFVMGQTIDKALTRSALDEKKELRYSYDMLGEGARTKAAAQQYFDVYAQAIESIGQQAVKTQPKGDFRTRPGISVKLSALNPRYEWLHRDQCLPELTERLKRLALECKRYDIGLTVDAEEATRLDLSLDLIEAVFSDQDLAGWEGFGIALQAYQKRAFYVIDRLIDMTKKAGRPMMVRLVKGAYWDTEIKRAQVDGWEGYPVFTRKNSTDVSYLACAMKLLQNKVAFYPQFATHNAHTVSSLLTIAEKERVTDYEFQRLHGMADSLYETVMKTHKVACRVYAPVGTHKDLLPYLVRRMLENGANSSFIHQISDPTVPVKDLMRSPVETARHYDRVAHSKIPLPCNLYKPERVNSSGYDLTDRKKEAELLLFIKNFSRSGWKAEPLLAHKRQKKGAQIFIQNPAVATETLGTVFLTEPSELNQTVTSAMSAFARWSKTPAEERAKYLEAFADLLEKNRFHFIALCALEAGKTLKDGIDEVREAVDFCRYYAAEGREKFAKPHPLPGPTGERNQLSYHGRGPFLCISPWNFPLAIFTGQIAAALMAGNTVLAKPAEQTSLIAYEAVRFMHKAGIPKDVLQLVLGKGSQVGPVLVADERVAGVAFTGSTEVAKTIQKGLAERAGAIVPLIAETGGQNAMIVDNTALPEQVVDDVIRSSFLSAGQRCSALRILCLQEEIAPTVLEMLQGAMDELQLGNPCLSSTDIGPVIDEGALKNLEHHVKSMKLNSNARLLHTVSRPDFGTFCAPHLIEIETIETLKEEVFGPILHVIRYKGKNLPNLVHQINSTGFGLTFGIHSRIDFLIQDVVSHVRAGNIYVNRSMTGAVVGVQPFGGEGLSGTGPKAGGPNYLVRFATERVISSDTTASGGNASLFALLDGEENRDDGAKS